MEHVRLEVHVYEDEYGRQKAALRTADGKTISGQPKIEIRPEAFGTLEAHVYLKTCVVFDKPDIEAIGNELGKLAAKRLRLGRV